MLTGLISTLKRSPVMIEKCHSFCLGCMAQKFEGQTGEFHCLQCDSVFSCHQVISCLVGIALVNELRITLKKKISPQVVRKKSA